MKKDNFENTVKQSFEEAPDILQKIKQDSRFRIPVKESKVGFFEALFSTKARYSFVSLFFILLIAMVYVQNSDPQQVYASTVTIDVNPSIEILLDEDDLVIEVNGLNGDGELVVTNQIEYNRMTIEQVMEVLITRMHALNFIVDTTEENVILIDVKCDNEAVRLRVLSNVMARADFEVKQYGQFSQVLRSDELGMTNNNLHDLDDEATQYGITRGKLAYVYTIIELDDSYTIADLADLSMRQLYQIEQDLLNNHPSNGQGQ